MTSKTNIIFTALCAFIISACTNDNSSNNSDYRGHAFSTVDSNVVVQTKLNHFYKEYDSICITQTYDVSYKGVTYKNSGPYISQVVYNNFKQHSINTHKIKGYKASTAQPIAKSLGCNLIVVPKILHWQGQAIKNNEVILRLSTYDAENLHLLNQATLRGRSKFDASNYSYDQEAIDYAIENYIHNLYQKI